MVEHRSPKPGAGVRAPPLLPFLLLLWHIHTPHRKMLLVTRHVLAAMLDRAKIFFQTCFDKSANLVTGREKKMDELNTRYSASWLSDDLQEDELLSRFRAQLARITSPDDAPQSEDISEYSCLCRRYGADGGTG